MIETEDYRHFLKLHLVERCRKNPAYSLRSFARDLKLNPSRLCEVLKHKSGLSVQKAEVVATCLGLSRHEKEWFVMVVQATDGRSRKGRIQASGKIQQLQKIHSDYQQINLDQFKIISDWYHFAIVDLISTKDFQRDPTWIARRLGISKVQAELALERLLKLGLVQVKNGKLKACEAIPSTPTDIPSEAIKTFHRQVLQKALEAIDFQTVAERDFSGVTLPIAKALLPEAKEKIKKFRREFTQWTKENKLKKDEVYILNLQMFRLSKEIP